LRDVFGQKDVVAVNKFQSDTDAEVAEVEAVCEREQVEIAICEGFTKGGDGMIELAKKVELLASGSDVAGEPELKFPYDLGDTIAQKIEKLAKKVYGANAVRFTKDAEDKIKQFEKVEEYSQFPVCVAKTQYSFSDNPSLLGAPSGFDITIRDIQVATGAKFFIAISGDIMRMPSLSANPAAYQIDLSDKNEIIGLF
jgi:formate--tetrahydrofolate ligase